MKQRQLFARARDGILALALGMVVAGCSTFDRAPTANNLAYEAAAELEADHQQEWYAGHERRQNHRLVDANPSEHLRR